MTMCFTSLTGTIENFIFIGLHVPYTCTFSKANVQDQFPDQYINVYLQF